MKSQTRQRTVLIGVRFTPDEEAAAAALAAEAGVTLPELIRRALLSTQHYTSTACWHAAVTDDPAEAERLHNYCQNDTGLSGSKTPAVCKHGGEPCRCSCHGQSTHPSD